MAKSMKPKTTKDYTSVSHETTIRQLPRTIPLVQWVERNKYYKRTVQ